MRTSSVDMPSATDSSVSPPAGDVAYTVTVTAADDQSFAKSCVVYT